MASAALAAVAVVVAVLTAAASAAVTYDRKAVVVNGQRRILLSGSIHYPRSVPEVRAAVLAPQTSSFSAWLASTPECGSAAAVVHGL
jgi:hypothetical protein